MILFLFLLLGQPDDTEAESIRNLGADSVEVRETAMANLKGRGRAILPELELALNKIADPEVRARITLVIKHLTQVRWHTDLALAMRIAAAEEKPLLVFSTMGELDGYT